MMRRELLWILAVKFAALGVLWLLFFSGTHHTHVDAARIDRQLALMPPGMEAPAGTHAEHDRD